jgi:hypothetical protein
MPTPMGRNQGRRPKPVPGLHDIVSKAKEMHAANRIWRYEQREDPGLSWTELPDWMKLSWFREAAAELEVEL